MAVLGLSAVTAGCSSPEVPAEKETAEEPEVVYDLTIGKETDETVETVLRNTLDQTITSIKIKKQSENDYSYNFLGNDEELKNGQVLQWFYEPQENSKTEDGENKKLNDTYTLELGLENGETLTLNEFTFGDVKDVADICEKDGIAYLTYTSASTGEKVNTFEQEKAAADKLKESQEQESPAESSKETVPATEEQPAAEESSYQEPAYQEPVYQEPVYQEPVVIDPAPSQDVGSQGSEGCLGGDVVFND